VETVPPCAQRVVLLPSLALLGLVLLLSGVESHDDRHGMCEPDPGAAGLSPSSLLSLLLLLLLPLPQFIA